MSYFIYVLFDMRDSYKHAGIDIILFIGVYISLQFHTRVIIWKKKRRCLGFNYVKGLG